MHPRRSAFLVLALVLPALCAAHTPALKVPSLAAMQRDAVESFNLTLGPVALGFVRFMSHFAGGHDPHSVEARNVLRGVHRVQIHSFEFATDRPYSQTDLEALRAQLTSPGWHQMVQVRNRSTNENVDIYCALDNHILKGIVILAAEPREFTLVSIVGTIDLNQVASLRSTFVRREHDPPPQALTQSEGSVPPKNDGP